MSDDARELAEFASAVRTQDAPPSILPKLKATILHNLGMLKAGSRLAGPGTAIADDDAGPSGATILSDGRRTHRDRAVIANAAMIHARTQDDTHLPAITHLAATCIPPLLATAESEGSTGQQLLDAMLVSYEVGAAVAVDAGPAMSARGFRPSSVLGGIAASAGVARLRGLDSAGMLSAIGLAASFGGGTGQTWVAGTDEWQYQVGVAGRNGMLAAELAAQGVKGAPDALEGAAGLYAAFVGTRTPHPGPPEVGTHWRTLEVTYKPFPICAINQMPVTVLLKMMAELDFTSEDIQTMELRLSPAEANYPGTDAYPPFASVSGSLMSAPFCLAVAAEESRVTRAMVEDLDNARYTALAARVSIVSDPELASGESVIVAKSGRRAFSSTEIDWPSPFDWDFADVHQRLVDLGDELQMTSRSLGALVDALQDLENLTVAELIPIITAA